VPVTPADIDAAVPPAGVPNRGLTNTALKGLITDIAAVGVGIGVGTVNTYADLPAPATVTGERWWVLTSTGVWLVNRRQKGAYYSDGAVWSYLGDFPVTAVEVGNTPAGGIAAVNVQAAIDELDGDKANVGAVGSTGITMSTARLLGRSTAGTGAVEEITLGTNLSFSGTTLNATGGGGGGGGSLDVQEEGVSVVGSANTLNFIGAGVTATSGGGSTANITIPLAAPDPLPLANVPSTPGAGILSVGRDKIAEFPFLAFKGPSGLQRLVQPFLGTIPLSGVTGFGGTALQPVGAAVAVAGAANAVSITNPNAGTRTPRVNLPTTAAAGNAVGIRTSSGTSWFVGNPTFGGGVFFFSVFTQGIDVEGKRVFVGASGSGSAPTNVNPAALTNAIGIGCIDGQDNWHIVFGGSAAQTPVDLGANFPCRTPLDDKIQFAFYWPPGDNSGFYYEVIRNDGAFTASGFVPNTTPGTTLPATSTSMGNLNCYWTNNATAAVMSMRVNCILTLVL